jgi:hypothetical protein
VTALVRSHSADRYSVACTISDVSAIVKPKPLTMLDFARNGGGNRARVAPAESAMDTATCLYQELLDHSTRLCCWDYAPQMVMLQSGV